MICPYGSEWALVGVGADMAQAHRRQRDRNKSG